jgi:hypothetical protein
MPLEFLHHHPKQNPEHAAPALRLKPETQTVALAQPIQPISAGHLAGHLVSFAGRNRLPWVITLAKAPPRTSGCGLRIHRA